MGTKVLFVGGEAGVRLWGSDAVDVYDSATEQWTAARLVELRAVGRVVTVGSRVLVAGGSRADSAGRLRASDMVDICDSATGQWSSARLSHRREALVAATVGTKRCSRAAMTTPPGPT